MGNTKLIGVYCAAKCGEKLQGIYIPDAGYSALIPKPLNLMTVSGVNDRPGGLFAQPILLILQHPLTAPTKQRPHPREGALCTQPFYSCLYRRKGVSSSPATRLAQQVGAFQSKRCFGSPMPCLVSECVCC